MNMLKWLILGFFTGGLLLGSVVSANAKARGGCTLTSGGNDDVENGDDNANGNDNGPADNGNSNSVTNENANGGTNSNANENTNTNTNGAANANENSNANANANANVNGTSNSNANDNGTDSGVTINARFAGTLSGTSVQSLDGAPQQPRDVRLLPSVQFEGAFTPLLLHVLHYADTSSGGGAATVETENLTNVLLGQTQTFNYNDGFPVTLQVDVTEASYQAREFRVVLTMTFNSVGGNLTRTGTGTQTIEGSLDASDNLILTIDAAYDVDLVAGSFSFSTTETLTLTGTLPRQ